MEKNLNYEAGQKFFVNKYQESVSCTFLDEMNKFVGKEGTVSAYDSQNCGSVKIFSYWWPVSALSRTRSIKTGTSVKLERFKPVDGLISNAGLDGLIGKLVVVTACENNLISFNFEGREYWWPIKNVVVHNYNYFEHETPLRVGDIVRTHKFPDGHGGLRYNIGMEDTDGTTAKIDQIESNGKVRFENHTWTYNVTSCEFIKSTRPVITQRNFPVSCFILGLVRNKATFVRYLIKRVDSEGLIVTRDEKHPCGLDETIKYKDLVSYEFPKSIMFNEWKTL